MQMQELDELITVLEANIPANPESPKNKRLADALERDMKKYFKQLEDAVPIEKLEKIYHRYAERD